MSAPMSNDTRAFDAYFHHSNGWVKGRIEFRRVQPGLLRFEFHAEDPKLMPPGPRVARRGVIEGVSNAEFPGTDSEARMHSTPPGHGMLFVTPRERPVQSANPTKLPFAVKDPPDASNALQQLRVEPQ